ncbi:rhodanese-like domain-containing protein [Caldilinea sp.]|uniref:rhodanese-like domain-containing protein n=1 Tax=Caldilinea sp. TaxID=2293560 RepID=UPI0021DCFD1C|nr:rhodanese-like domain-containing protein [Caldilinea sp.]GIV71200.1 MAG: hypothetical protein KatS3mg048_4062 [Caldilinea sp.]
MSMSQTDFRRYVALILIAIGLLWGLNACSAGQPAAAASQPVAAAVKVKAKITPAEYQARFGANADHILIDVRTPEEFAGGHIPGAVNISVEQLAQRLSEIPKDKPVVLYCRSGNRSNQAAQILERAGYSQIYDLGGIITWAQQGYPIQ